jgi:tetratricopeptide (TPR) repeat protein
MVILYLAAAGAGRAGRLPLYDARTAALGASPALAPGFYAVGTNPAVLAELSHMQFTFLHKIYPAPHTSLEGGGAAVPLGRYGTLAGGFGTVLVGDVERYSPRNDPLGTYLYHDDRVTAGYGARVNRWFALGGAVNYERHVTSPDREHHTFGCDLGLYAHALGAGSSWEYAAGVVTLAFTAHNVVASEPDSYSGDYREPRRFNVGAAWARDIDRHRLTLAFGLPLHEPSRASFGCEFDVAALLAARVGLVGTHPAGGVGVNTNRFSFDYSYVARELDPAHYFTVSYNPGRDLRGRGAVRRRREKWLAQGRAYYEAADYALAAERFAAVLEEDPHNTEARQYWIRSKYRQYMEEGKTHLARQEWEPARAAFRGALVAVPEDFLASEFLGRVDELEAAEQARRAEEARLSGLLAEAEDLKRRGAYRQALARCAEILAARPDHAEATRLAAEVRRLLAASLRPVAPLPTPEIPEEATDRYREASAALGRGAVGEAVRSLEDLLVEYPTYAAAQGKLVEAYLYQGLDFYSKGSLSAAIRVWSKGLALDPGNDKLQRYIYKAEVEIEQIR